jgi:hypothetical protein
MNWSSFAAAAPELAEFAVREFDRAGVATLGTIRADGSPRISCVEPCVLDGSLYLGMMWRSRKAVDLFRDPRLVLRNPICSNTGDEAELSLRGRAVEVTEPERRRRFVDAVAERTEWREPHFQLFDVEIDSAALVRYGGGAQSVTLWPQGTSFTRTYG